ncbi:MAG: hypothetical protein JWP34_4606 [Massilia sp.]|nr:hypothetical protein [Massilia sp.]
MKIGIIFPGVLLGLVVLGGCAHEAPKPAASADWRENLPAPRIDSAAFVGTGMLRDTIQVKGAYFKLKSNEKDDLIISTNGTIWVPATKITDSSGTSYSATIPYTANYAAVMVKVFGMNGHYSGPVAVTR